MRPSEEAVILSMSSLALSSITVSIPPALVNSQQLLLIVNFVTIRPLRLRQTQVFPTREGCTLNIPVLCVVLSFIHNSHTNWTHNLVHLVLLYVYTWELSNSVLTAGHWGVKNTNHHMSLTPSRPWYGSQSCHFKHLALKWPTCKTPVFPVCGDMFGNELSSEQCHALHFPSLHKTAPSALASPDWQQLPNPQTNKHGLLYWDCWSKYK